MITPIFLGIVKNGKLYVKSQWTFDRYLETLEGNVEVIVRKKRLKRSDRQNRYYWGVIIPLYQEMIGEIDKDIVHNFLRTQFLESWIKIKDKEYPIVKSTTQLNTKEFEDYCEKCRQLAPQLFEGAYIPLPNEVEYG